MQPFAYALLFLGAFAGGFVAGLAGFGTALMALGIWLYVLPPSDAVPLILICSVVAQSWTLPSLWRSFDFTLIRPFVIGGLIGVPLGTLLVAQADHNAFKLTVGVFLLLFPLALYFSKPMYFRFGGRPARCGDRLCRRHPWRAGRLVRPASDSVGDHPRLGQGRTARHLPDL